MRVFNGITWVPLSPYLGKGQASEIPLPRGFSATRAIDAGGESEGLGAWVYEPPASCFARRVPLLLRKKGRVRGFAKALLVRR